MAAAAATAAASKAHNNLPCAVYYLRPRMLHGATSLNRQNAPPNTTIVASDVVFNTAKPPYLAKKPSPSENKSIPETVAVTTPTTPDRPNHPRRIRPPTRRRPHQKKAKLIFVSFLQNIYRYRLLCVASRFQF